MNNLSFKYKTKINQPLNKIFDFYSNPKNIKLLTPWFVKVSCTPEKKISKKGVFTIEINIFGIKNKVEILIKNHEENKFFTDLQIKGPFNYWEHNHIFKYENNETIMYDVINYNSKFKLLDKMYIFHLIFKIVFYYREKKILAIF
tara:strand:- start:582 stop:1016 length:435 start_codon:yes stop_codon:yes gene_type:complete